jgi:hypothetical protein
MSRVLPLADNNPNNTSLYVKTSDYRRYLEEIVASGKVTIGPNTHNSKHGKRGKMLEHPVQRVVEAMLGYPRGLSSKFTDEERGIIQSYLDESKAYFREKVY